MLEQHTQQDLSKNELADVLLIDIIDIQRTFSDCNSSKYLISLYKLSLTKMDMPYIPPVLLFINLYPYISSVRIVLFLVSLIHIISKTQDPNYG